MNADTVPYFLFEKNNLSIDDNGFNELPAFSLPAKFNGIAIVCFSENVMSNEAVTTLQNTIKWLEISYEDSVIIVYNKRHFPLNGWKKFGVKKMVIFGKEAVESLKNITINYNKPFLINDTEIIIGEKLDDLPKLSPQEKKLFAGGIKNMLKN